MKIIAANSRATYDYFIEQKIDAGLVLTGSEVKSLRINTGSIRGAYINDRNGELWLSNCFIKKYNNSKDSNYDPNRERKLLITKKQYNKIIGATKNSGFSMIPISLYFTDRGLAKLIFDLGKGKKKFDKRQTIKEKDWKLKKNRILKNN